MCSGCRRVGVEFHAAQDGKTAADKAFCIDRQTRELPVGAIARWRRRGTTIRFEQPSVAGRDGMSPHLLTGDRPAPAG